MHWIEVRDAETGGMVRIRVEELPDQRNHPGRYMLVVDRREHSILQAIVARWSVRDAQSGVWRWQWRALVGIWGFVVTVAVVVGAIAGLISVVR